MLFILASVPSRLSGSVGKHLFVWRLMVLSDELKVLLLPNFAHKSLAGEGEVNICFCMPHSADFDRESYHN